MLITAFTVLVLQQTPRIWVNTEAAAIRAGYALKLPTSQRFIMRTRSEGDPAELVARASNSTTQCSLELMVRRSVPDYEKLKRINALNGHYFKNVAHYRGSNQAMWQPTAPIQGYPIGDVDAIWATDQTYAVNTFVGDRFIVLRMASNVRSKPGSRYGSVSKMPESAHRENIETIARWFAAEYRGLLATVGRDSMTVGSDSTPYLALVAWSKARGWAVRTNEEAGTVYLTKGSHTILAPVGTNAMKVDGKWIRTRGVTFYKNGTYYADVASLP